MQVRNFILALPIIAGLLSGCKKDTKVEPIASACDIEKTYLQNETKVSATTGLYGTLASMEGNCMPMIGPGPWPCTTCPIKRTVRIYSYTMITQATPQNGRGFYDSFSTQLIKEVETDNDGFYQIDLVPGDYTIVAIENGKLYAFGFDGSGGLSPVHYAGGKQKLNLTMIYKAVF